MEFLITEKGEYSILVMRNGYRNAGYDVYKNSEKICTVAQTNGTNELKEGISYKSYSFICEVGDIVSISNIQASVTIMSISALLIKSI